MKNEPEITLYSSYWVPLPAQNFNRNYINTFQNPVRSSSLTSNRLKAVRKIAIAHSGIKRRPQIYFEVKIKLLAFN
jgi:hypothetical protein